MLALADRWCDLPASIRLTSWLLMLLLVGAACGFYGRAENPSAENVNLQAQWRKMMPLRHDDNTPPAEPTALFSAIDFQRSLVSWQPTGRGGELVLENDHLRLTMQLEAISHE